MTFLFSGMNLLDGKKEGESVMRRKKEGKREIRHGL